MTHFLNTIKFKIKPEKSPIECNLKYLMKSISVLGSNQPWYHATYLAVDCLVWREWRSIFNLFSCSLDPLISSDIKVLASSIRRLRFDVGNSPRFSTTVSSIFSFLQQSIGSWIMSWLAIFLNKTIIWYWLDALFAVFAVHLLPI